MNASPVLQLRFNRGQGKNMRCQRGFTLVEIIVATSILLVLMGAAVPVMRLAAKRQRETDLRRGLLEIRSAIDRYRDVAEKYPLAFQKKLGTQAGTDFYPPDLDTLVKGLDLQGKKVRFLRRVPVDPMTGSTEWGMRSTEDDAASDSWGGQNVFDVYTKSDGTGLNGTKYKDW